MPDSSHLPESLVWDIDDELDDDDYYEGHYDWWDIVGEDECRQ